jgi:hypothetical protein
VTEHTDQALRDAEERLRRAHGDTWAIDRRAAELAAELPAGELYLRLARALGRDPRGAG